MGYSILKSGSVVKTGSVLNDTPYNTDTTLTDDLTVQSITIGTHKSAFTYTQIEQAINFALTQVAVPFSTSETYAVTDFVVHDGFLYQCKTAITTPGAWDSSKWEIQKIFDNEGYVQLNSHGVDIATTQVDDVVVIDNTYNVNQVGNDISL